MLLEREPPSRTGEQAGYSGGLSRLSVLQSVRRRPFLTALPIVVLVLLGIAYSLQRTPVYTAEARMTVDRIDLSQPGALNGFATATQALATAYSRAISAQEVIQRVAAETRLDPLEVRNRLNATPIPQSPLFRIQATGVSSEAAERLANRASEALRDFVRENNRASPVTSRDLLEAYEREQFRVARASQDLATAKETVQADRTASNKRALARAQATFSAAQLRATAASTSYTANASSGTTNGSVTILAPASFAINDRRSKTQIYAFVALLLGAFIGAALATLAEDRRFRRSLRSRGR